jgi:hypothetical protein
MNENDVLLAAVHAGSPPDGNGQLFEQAPQWRRESLMGAYTGRLNAARVPPANSESFWRTKSKSRPSLKGFLLEEIPDATEYSDDPELCDPVEIVRLIKAFPEIDRRLSEAFYGAPDPSLCQNIKGKNAPERKRGRPRVKGRFDLLYVAYVASGDPAMESFWKRWRSSELWKECGFDKQPPYQRMWDYFTSFEKLERRGFREEAQLLIRNAKKHDRLIGTALIIDETRFDSVSRHEHCCPDPVACRDLWKNQKKELGEAAKGRKGPPAVLIRATDETYNEWKAKELAEPELVDGELPETVAPAVRVEGAYLYRVINGHYYRTLDTTGGLRRYSFPRNESWHGGLLQAAVCPRYRTAIDLQAFAADHQAYDHLPELYANIEESTGERPLVASLDALYTTKPVAEFFIRRGTHPIRPHSKRESPERIDMRCDLFDEHQVIRCPSCGAETDQEPYYVFHHSKPVVRVRCRTPHAERCYGLQSVSCDKHWGWIGILDYEDRLTNQMREKHGQMEGFWDSMRKRYGLAGKDTSGKIKRRSVVPAQMLRAEAALLIEWLRLSLRHGFIGSWKKRNENGPVIVADRGRHAKIMRARAKRALRFPYGAQAVVLGLAKPPPDPEPEPPPVPAAV